MFICSVFPSAQILVVTQPGMNIQDFHFSGRFLWHSIVIRSLSLIFQTIVRAQQFPVPPDFVSCYCRYYRPQITQYPAAIDTIPSDVPLTVVLNFQHEFPNYFQKDSVLTIPTSWSQFKQLQMPRPLWIVIIILFILPVVDGYHFADASPKCVIRIEAAPIVGAANPL